MGVVHRTSELVVAEDSQVREREAHAPQFVVLSAERADLDVRPCSHQTFERIDPEIEPSTLDPRSREEQHTSRAGPIRRTHVGPEDLGIDREVDALGRAARQTAQARCQRATDADMLQG